LELRVGAEAAEIFARHSLEGFEVTLHVGYASCADHPKRT
jgi:hypothetical protein